VKQCVFRPSSCSLRFPLDIPVIERSFLSLLASTSRKPQAKCQAKCQAHQADHYGLPVCKPPRLRLIPNPNSGDKTPSSNSSSSLLVLACICFKGSVDRSHAPGLGRSSYFSSSRSNFFVRFIAFGLRANSKSPHGVFGGLVGCQALRSFGIIGVP